MLRNNRISLGFNDSEYKELQERAKESHLRVGDYIRWYLFKLIEIPTMQYQQPLTQQVTIPYKAAPEVIERIKAGKDAYIDPYQEARLEAMSDFKKSGSLGELHNNIKMMAHGGRVLQNIPKGDMKTINKERDKRKHVANKHLEEIKQKNIAVGILDNE